MKNMIDFGVLVISLDFELLWGGIDIFTPEGYGKSNIKNVPIVIEKMLQLFQKYEIHATFATVGMIMHNSKSEAIKNIPLIVPTYLNKKLSPYNDNYIESISKNNENLYYHADLVDKIKKFSGMEIGTHTYCHYYCWENGQTVEQFEADINKAIEVAKNNNIIIRSIVFPRNNISLEYLRICEKYGIVSYRGNALKYYNYNNYTLINIKNRVCRLLDSYLNIGGMTGIPINEIDNKENMINLRASRILRPYSKKLSCFEFLRLNRIKNEMLYAAQHHQMYHLWWHPHNMGNDIKNNFDFLENVLKCYKDCKIKYNMHSYNMNEMYNFLSGKLNEK